jgi:hypothetical protein
MGIMLDNPSGLAVDDEGNLYISDYVTSRVRRVDVHAHIINTVAGNGKPYRVESIMVAHSRDGHMDV